MILMVRLFLYSLCVKVKIHLNQTSSELQNLDQFLKKTFNNAVKWLSLNRKTYYTETVTNLKQRGRLFMTQALRNRNDKTWKIQK